MQITFLGSGTSHGVPMIGCECQVCLSDNPCNKRTRPSIAVAGPSGVILIDTSPELRLQAIACGLKRVDAVLITHTHADHIFGMDDLRRFNDLSNSEIPLYGVPETLEDIQRIFRYIFVPTQAGGGKPRLTLHPLPEQMELCGLHVRTFVVMHGALPVQAFRFTDPHTGRSAAYVTDVNFIPPEAEQHLHNLDLLILDAVRYEPHSTHFGLWQALEAVEKLQPRQTLLTHLSHHFDHQTLTNQTPPNVAPACDGQQVVV